MFTLPPAYVCPALGGTDPLVCPASCPQDVPETLFPATRRSGPRRPGWRGGGAVSLRGSMSGHENEGGGGEGTSPTGSASFLPRLSLPGCQPGAGVDRMNPMASAWVGHRVGVFCWAPGHPGLRHPSLPLCPALKSERPIYYSSNQHNSKG